MVTLGLILIALGGFGAGSFYIPFKKVRNWAWETYWIFNGLIAWFIMPIFVAFLTVPELISVLREVQTSTILTTWFLGFLWGVGGLTFGLSMRYLGMSLGYAIALGLCAFFGTLIPPIYRGKFNDLVTTTSGWTTLTGVIVCLIGIAICAWAGMSKERELSDEKKKEAIKEFNFTKGLLVAILSGVMNACMAFGFDAGKPIADLAIEYGTPSMWVNNPLYIVLFSGGFATNLIWCVYLNVKNKTIKDYINSSGSPLINNYIFSALAGIIWYIQYLFYGMGRTCMGKYDFASWSAFMALIIVFSNIWGLIFREWKGTSRRTHQLIFIGIIVLIASTILVGFGNYLASLGK